MKQYKVIRTCTFDGRRLREGDIMNYPDDIVVPRHLQLIGESSTPKLTPKADDGQMALSQLPVTPKVPNGFAYQAEETANKRVKTAGEKSKGKK